jgi:tRNA-2-methylthio-N6-dimethylallyladenosine synthase
MVEGENSARGQWTGRTSQNKTLNFTVENGSPVPSIGQYVNARVTKTLPNSLVGEQVL